MNRVMGCTAIAAIVAISVGVANSLIFKSPEVGMVCFVVAAVALCGILIYIGVKALETLQ